MLNSVPKPTRKKRERKRINTVSKKDRTKFKNKAINKAKWIIRTKIGCCEICGKSGVQLHAHHVIPVGFEATAADPENLMCLCAQCHRLNKYSAHQNPIWFTEWYETYAPGKKKILQERAYQIPNYSAQDWKDKYEHLNKTANELGLE